VRPRITLVTPAHVASNPRLVKEADALAEVGYEVHVVGCRYFGELDEADHSIVALADWSYDQIDWTRPEFSKSRLTSRLLRKLVQGGAPLPLRFSRHAVHPALTSLVKAVQNTGPDLVVGHCLPGLVAAALAAIRTRKPWRFDAEDFHSAETLSVEDNPHQHRHVQRIERKYLPTARQITAASPAIGEAYQKTYALPARPVTLLNVFPRNQFPEQAPSLPPPTAGKRLYWFSQTIGPGRGLEALLRVLAGMKTSCSLHLRGMPAAGFPESLAAQARSVGFSGQIEWLEFGLANEMLRMASVFDLGLSLEESRPRNRDLCLTNKIFTYLGAGIPVAITPTTAQRALSSELGPSALLIDLNRPDETAGLLDQFLSSPERQSKARQSAKELGISRFNWDVEKLQIIKLTKDILPL